MTMTCWPHTCASGSAMSRAITSSELPAAVCTMILTGRLGNSSARAIDAVTTSASATQARARTDRSRRIRTFPCNPPKAYPRDRLRSSAARASFWAHVLIGEPASTSPEHALPARLRRRPAALDLDALHHLGDHAAERQAQPQAIGLGEHDAHVLLGPGHRQELRQRL